MKHDNFDSPRPRAQAWRWRIGTWRGSQQR
jgi:hypothetical protein